MSDMSRLSVSESWVAIGALALNGKYSLQNISGESMYLTQQPTAPVKSDTGKELMPNRSATLIKELNPIFIRMKTGTGIAHFDQFLS